MQLIDEQLRQSIRQSGQSISELAKSSGVDKGRLSRFVRGERTITIKAAAKICAALGLELKDVEPRK